MLESQKLELRRSTVRERLNEIGQLQGDAYTDAIKTEERALQAEYQTLEQRQRSALIAEGKEAETRAADVAENGLKPEERERIELRSKARLSNYFQAFSRGRVVDGAEAELAAAAGITPGAIPIELFDVPMPGQRQMEQRAVTPAPSTVGVNLDPIRPAVFANSIASRLGIDMPRVMSGTYASATITTSQTAAAKTKGDDQAATAGALTVQTATPKRVSARLELTLEDIAAIGQNNFESILRQNLGFVLSDQLDNQAINGNGTAPNLAGILSRLTDPTAGTTVPTFDTFLAAFAGAIDGLWANTMKEVGMVVGPATYRLAARAFRDAGDGAKRGDIAFTDYAMQHTGGFWTNKRMPAAASDNQAGIVYRMGRSMMGGSGAMRTAVCPHWGEISIDDIYSGAASGTRSFTMHVLLGDVILVQPDAYSEVTFHLA